MSHTSLRLSHGEHVIRARTFMLDVGHIQYAHTGLCEQIQMIMAL